MIHRRPKLRPVKELIEHCPECEERLQGNNSIAWPWYCSCGTWCYVTYGENAGTYEIKSNKDESKNIKN